MTNEVGNTHGGNADNNGYWAGSGTTCQSMAGSSYTGNTFGAAADTALWT